MIETVSQSVTTAIATSVASSVSSSVAAATGGSTSVPSANPAGIISMISVLQTMDMKMNLQIGEIPATFKGLAGSIPWINFDIDLFPEDNSNGRKLLFLDESSPEMKKSVNLLILFTVTMIPLTIAHYIIQKYKTLPGVVGFPQLEFTLLLVFTNPFVKSTGALFSTGNYKEILFGIGLLFVIPIPLLGYSIHIIKHYVTHTRTVKFITFEEIKKQDTFGSFIKRCFLSSNYGHWKCKGKILDTHGIFFNTIRGPIHIPKDKHHIIRWVEQTNQYKYNKWVLYPEMFQWIRTYYRPYLLSKNIIVILFLQGFQFSPYGNISQIIFLCLFYLIHLSTLFIVAPFNGKKDQLTEVLTSICELGTYFCGILILMVRRGTININIALLEQALFALQSGTVAIQIISQMAILVVIAVLLKEKIQLSFFLDKTIKKNRSLYLQKKYGNRWLFKVFRRAIGQKKVSIAVSRSMKYLL